MCEPKISQANMTKMVEEDVFEFEITIDEVVGMKDFEA